MRLREKVAWGAVVALAIGVTAALAGVARSGPLDPPGPPASTGIHVVEETTPREFRTVARQCNNGDVQGAIDNAMLEVNQLGANQWNIIGAPAITGSAPCMITFTLSRPLGVGAPACNAMSSSSHVASVAFGNSTDTATATPTGTPTATPTGTLVAVPTCIVTPTAATASTYVVSATLQPGFPSCGDAANCIVTAHCDAGDSVTGGAATNNIAGYTLDYSSPIVGGWTARWFNANGGEEVVAICLDNPPRHAP